MMRLPKLIVAVLLAICTLPTSGRAQTAPDGWVLLHSAVLDLAAGKLTIALPDNRARSKAIRLVAVDAGVRLDRVVITYANGQMQFEDEPIELARGAQSPPLGEREEPIVIDSVALAWRAPPNPGSLTLQVWSLPELSPRPRNALQGPADPKGYRELSVLYGTTRKRDADRVKNGRALATFIGSEAAGTALTLGRAIVTIPIEREIGAIPRPEFNFIFARIALRAEDPKRDFTLAAVDVTGERGFLELLRAQSRQADRFRSQAFVFVHGYNVGFDDAIFRTAQIAHDIGFDGPAITFSWPSRGSTLGYKHDVDAAKGSRDALRRVLELISADSSIASVNLVAHSMGNDPVLEVLGHLGDIRRAGGATKDLKLKEIVLAAPDVSRTVFEQLARKFSAQAGHGITLYASAADKAQLLSKKIAGDIDRAGDVPAGGPLVVAGIETIDVSDAGTSFFSSNHSSFADREQLVEDMRRLFQSGQHPPSARFAEFRQAGTAQRRYWRYFGK